MNAPTRVIGSIAATLPLLLGTYVAAYFWLGECVTGKLPGGPGRVEFSDRQYKQPWMVNLFKPAGWLEAKLRQRDVYLDSPSAEQPAIKFVP